MSYVIYMLYNTYVNYIITTSGYLAFHKTDPAPDHIFDVDFHFHWNNIPSPQRQIFLIKHMMNRRIGQHVHTCMLVGELCDGDWKCKEENACRSIQFFSQRKGELPVQLLNAR